MTTTTIDCQTCPVRGRHCGDCFVPVLGRLWLQDPRPRPGADGDPDPLPTGDAATGGLSGALGELLAEPLGEPLDDEELAAVGAFVRAGLVTPDEAADARARVSAVQRSAAG